MDTTWGGGMHVNMHALTWSKTHVDTRMRSLTKLGDCSRANRDIDGGGARQSFACLQELCSTSAYPTRMKTRGLSYQSAVQEEVSRKRCRGCACEKSAPARIARPPCETPPRP
ncbi:unnamed protein product, partial [Iphiclides podalirius]